MYQNGLALAPIQSVPRDAALMGHRGRTGITQLRIRHHEQLQVGLAPLLLGRGLLRGGPRCSSLLALGLVRLFFAVCSCRSCILSPVRGIAVILSTLRHLLQNTPP